MGGRRECQSRDDFHWLRSQSQMELVEQSRGKAYLVVPGFWRAHLGVFAQRQCPETGPGCLPGFAQVLEEE